MNVVELGGPVLAILFSACDLNSTYDDVDDDGLLIFACFVHHHSLPVQQLAPHFFYETSNSSLHSSTASLQRPQQPQPTPIMPSSCKDLRTSST